MAQTPNSAPLEPLSNPHHHELHTHWASTLKTTAGVLPTPSSISRLNLGHCHLYWDHDDSLPCSSCLYFCLT